GVEGSMRHVDARGPLLVVERGAMENSGQVIELGNHCCRPDMHNFETTLVGR
ncbi:MAG: GntR family transcriptional regulator, partial [Corynebacterium sp.]|nr:GntR family transcriptional regulator [Corynebacterium sp.]